MKRYFRPSIGFLTLAALLAIGCDQPNDPDLPEAPAPVYRLEATYASGGLVSDLDVGEDRMVVGLEYVGFDVLDISALPAVSVVDSYRIRTAGARCRVVAIDERNSLVAGFMPANATPYPIWSYAFHTRVSGIAASGAVEGIFMSAPDTAVLWMTDRVGDNFMEGERLIRQTDSSWRWDPTFSASRRWVSPSTEARVQRFDLDHRSMLAIAWNAGITIFNGLTGQEMSVLLLPDRAKDCAWVGNLILVAAEFRMLLVDAADLAQPRLIGQFNIHGADRLRQIDVDGDYAALMDESDGVYVVDISDPTAPRLAQTLPLPESVEIIAKDGRLYIGDRTRGLLILNRN